MTPQINAPCPLCGGATISKGKGSRMCKPCDYRFPWPPIYCRVCGKPKSKGKYLMLPYCEEHYPTEVQRHRMNRQKARQQQATTPAAPSYVVKHDEPAKRAPGKSIVVDGDTIEITPDGLLVMNGGYPLPASCVEIALWKRIMGQA